MLCQVSQTCFRVNEGYPWNCCSNSTVNRVLASHAARAVISPLTNGWQHISLFIIQSPIPKHLFYTRTLQFKWRAPKLGSFLGVVILWAVVSPCHAKQSQFLWCNPYDRFIKSPHAPNTFSEDLLASRSTYLYLCYLVHICTIKNTKKQVNIYFSIDQIYLNFVCRFA